VDSAPEASSSLVGASDTALRLLITDFSHKPERILAWLARFRSWFTIQKVAAVHRIR